MVIKILVLIGILAIIAGIQIIENTIRGVSVPHGNITPVGWLKFGFFIYLLWNWVSTVVVG